jgi:hypothetical protein
MGITAIRDNHPDFIAAKTAFDQTRALLSTLKSDTELKKLLSWPTELNATLQTFQTHLEALRAPEKAKEYNRVLASAFADLTTLKSELTAVPQDQQTAEVARSRVPSVVLQPPEPVWGLISGVERSVPDVAKTVTGLGAALASTGLVTESSWKQTIADSVWKVKNWILSFFEGDSMIAKLFWGLRERVAWFMDALGRHFPVAGAVASTLPEWAPRPSDRYGTTVMLFKKFIGSSHDHLPISDYLLKPEFQKRTLSELESLHKSKNYSALYPLVSHIPDEAKKKAALDAIFSHIFDSETLVARALEWSYRSYKKIPKNTPIDRSTVTLEEYFSASSISMQRLSAIPKALSAGKDSLVGMMVKDGKLAGVDASTGELDIYKFESPATREKYLITLLTATGGTIYQPDIGKKDHKINEIMKISPWLAGLSLQERNEIAWELQKLLTFADDFTRLVTTHQKVNLGMGNEMSSILKNNWLTMSWILLMYHTLGGNTDYENMSLMGKISIHSMVTWIFWIWEWADSGKLAGKYVAALRDSKPHDEIKHFAIETGKVLGVQAAKWVWNGVKWTAGFMTEAPDIGAFLIWLNLPFFNETTSILWKIT